MSGPRLPAEPFPADGRFSSSDAAGRGEKRATSGAAGPVGVDVTR